MILDFYPTQAFFKPNQKPQFVVLTDKAHLSVEGLVEIYRLGKKIETIEIKGELQKNAHVVSLASTYTYGGYIVRISDGKTCKLTAFDILDTWLDFPRYGYVSDFSPNRDDLSEKIETMTKYHVNGVQFYDWQYRHDALLPSQTEYLDPFDRPMSMKTVNGWINACHSKGMVAMPYLAVYAASVDFWHKHKDWGMYDKSGEPLMFEDFLGLVDPSYKSDWFKHIDEECDRVLQKTQFDGLHIDQYGEPKQAFTVDGKEIDIPKAFVDFINHQKGKENGYVVFNAVGDWPTKDLAKSDADFMYIEVWDFTPTFEDLRRIVADARALSGQKPVVVPIYIKQKDFTNVLLADAVIAASGGTHLEIGDGDKLLSDPYFPKAEEIDDEQRCVLRKYWDFIVGNQDVLGPKAKAADIDVTIKADVMTIARKNGKYTAVSVINCKASDQWIAPMPEPLEQEKIGMTIQVNATTKHVWVGSPDQEDYRLNTLEFNEQNDKLAVTLPKLKYWTTVVIEEE